MNKEEIKSIILKEIKDADLKFEGDSCNFNLTVTSSIFKDLPIIDQHKLVLNLLRKNFASGSLHALSLNTKIK